MVVNIQGSSSMFSAKAEDGSTYGLQGSKVLWFKRDDKSSQFFIYDHCTIVGKNMVAGDGCIFVADLGSDITIANINYFSGDRGAITPVTITNSAIKINSAVTMYINTDNVINGTKTNGSITLTASSIGSVNYELEIFATTTEGLFEIINKYKPVLTESMVLGWGFTKNTGTVTAIVANGTNFDPDSTGRVDLGTVLTSHQDISGKANLAGNNTFTGGQTITGQTSDGYSVNASGYVKGSWLQSSVKSNKGSGTGMVCVFDSNGWIYYRTPREIVAEGGIDDGTL